MTSNDQQPVAREARRWAPWWVYLVGILAVNYLRQIVWPFGTLPEILDVLIALGLAAVVFAVVTLVARSTGAHGPDPNRPSQ